MGKRFWVWVWLWVCADHTECPAVIRVWLAGCKWNQIKSKQNALQHTATYCNTLQHTATHCNTLQHTECAAKSSLYISLRHVETHVDKYWHTWLRCIHVDIHDSSVLYTWWYTWLMFIHVYIHRPFCLYTPTLLALYMTIYMTYSHT